ncbi:FAD-dependent oxidoreductase [Hydrogenobaculum acidophilum]
MLKYDIVIVGGGGAGLMAAIEASKDKNIKIAVVSKVFPTRSHTGAAQGGMNASIGIADPNDSFEKHAFDTIKGSDFLADQQAVLFMCKYAPELIYELDRMGVPFSRTKEGKIAQRPFGGASFPRTVYSADRTGHVLLHTLFEQTMSKENIDFFNEYFLLDIDIQDNKIDGLELLNIKDSSVLYIKTKVLILAGGGFARIYWHRSTNASGNTGDLQAIALRKGVALKDMEFIQFHPTGLAKTGILLSEASRGEGGYLINARGERFMSKYSPNKMELAPRDIVSRAIELEIKSGLGIGEGTSAYVYLDLRHLGEEKLNERLPQVRQLAIDFEGVDPAKAPIPIRPTAHYCMGGIDIIDFKSSETSVKGLLAIGECACVSVHGANRLGGNSLTELVVFGKHAGEYAREYAKNTDFSNNKPSINSESYINSLMQREGNIKLYEVRNKMGETTWFNMGIFRTEESLKKAYEELTKLLDMWNYIPVSDKSRVFNTNLIELLELKNMLELSRVVALCALNRRESRGGHSREDYKERDDKNFLKHSIVCYNESGELSLTYKDVDTSLYKPEERKY